MNGMSVKDMVVECLDCHGFDGLYNEAGCGCMSADLAPCDEMSQRCEAAYLFDCQRCTKRPTCDLADEEQPWLMLPSKNFCTPEYAGDALAVASAARSATLPACAPLTVGEVARAGIKPEWHAHGGAVEGGADGIEVGAGELLVPISTVMEVVKAALDKVLAPDAAPEATAAPESALKVEQDEKEACQNTAKAEPVNRMLKEDGTAEYMRFLEFGA